MKTLIIDAKAIKEKEIVRLSEEVNYIKETIEREPHLVIVSAGDSKSSELYMNNKVKTGKEVGIRVSVKRFEKDISQKELEDYIDHLNENEEVDAIIIQLPIYEHLNKDDLIQKIKSNKDADGFSFENIGKMIYGIEDSILPCTAKSVMKIIDYHDIQVCGKKVVIIGRGLHTAKSVANLMINRGATVTICNSKTVDLKKEVQQGDVVISSVGKYKLIDPKWMKKSSALIGIGIEYIDGRQETDYSVSDIVNESECSMVSNRINSVGVGTVLFLIENTIELCKANRM